MRKQVLPALRLLMVFTVVLGLGYPLAMTAVGQTFFHERADGQLIEHEGAVVGSALIGQNFVGEEYFHTRPSATEYTSGPGYAFGSNEGPTSERLLTEVDRRVEEYRAQNDLSDEAAVPVDAVTGSGSSLDPHISVANARLQAARVARERGVDEQQVLDLIEAHTDRRTLGFLGEDRVNVLLLNLALDETTDR